MQISEHRSEKEMNIHGRYLLFRLPKLIVLESHEKFILLTIKSYLLGCPPLLKFSDPVSVFYFHVSEWL